MKLYIAYLRERFAIFLLELSMDIAPKDFAETIAEGIIHALPSYQRKLENELRAKNATK